MTERFVIPVFHHGENFVRNDDGRLVYVNEKVEKFSEMDIDFINFGDLVKLFEGLGYPGYKAIYWFDSTANDIESGLHSLTGDSGIRELCNNLMKNEEKDEFYIYFDHPVNEPEYAEKTETENVESDNADTIKKGSGMKGIENVEAIELDDICDNLVTSSSDDGYESTEDEPYKPPPPGYDDDSDDEESSEEEKRVNKKRKMACKGKKVVVPKKKLEGNKEKGLKRKDAPKKKRSNVVGRGPDVQPSVRTNAGQSSGPSVQTGGPSNGPTIHSSSSDSEYNYEYHSEDLHTPASSDEESEKHHWPEFNDEYEFGEGHFEVGTKFATLDKFKEVVKDMFISDGREFKWIKNDKERVRVGCKGEECPWVVHVSYNNSLRCFQVKTFKSEHTCARDMGSNAIEAMDCTCLILETLTLLWLVSDRD